MSDIFVCRKETMNKNIGTHLKRKLLDCNYNTFVLHVQLLLKERGAKYLYVEEAFLMLELGIILIAHLSSTILSIYNCYMHVACIA